MRKTLAILALWSVSSAAAWAHDPGLSSAALTIGDREVSAVLTFNERDLRSLAAENDAQLASEALELRANGTPLAAKLEAVDRAENENVAFRLSYPRPQSGTLAISSGLLGRLPFGHRQFASVRTAGGAMIEERLLSARENVFSVSLAAIPAAHSSSRFFDFFLLGVRHIVTGYDHLLFLFGLLIVCRGPRGALLLITCFTLAHSLTLALSTFGLVTLPSRWVEAAIAASILYVGIENLIRRDGLLRGRWLLTFAFGLVHGLGFASVLREMGVAQQGMSAVLPLFAFNVGVEAGQLSIAALVLPIIWKLRERGSFLRVGVPACSVLVAAAGAFWLLERTFGS